MDVIYVGQEIDINWSIRRNASEILEDFSKADLKVFLTGNDFDGNYDGKYYFANIIDDQGRVRLVIEAGSLTPGTYCIEGIWIKNSHELLNSGWTRSISRARKDRIFKVSDVEEECTDYNEDEGHVVEASHEINIATGTTSYGYDGMSAYETAVFNGSTAKTEKEWIDTYEKAEDRVNYEMDPDNDGEEQGDHESWAHKVDVNWNEKEAARQTAENTRKAAEGIGATDADCAPGSRRKNESIRIERESARVTAEETRSSNENTRKAKEAARQAAENIRIQNEGTNGSGSTGWNNSRIKKEQDRQAAEETRQQQEETRQQQEGSPDDEPSGSGSRWARYKHAEAERNTLYGTAEAARQSDFGTAQTSRQSAYNTAEAGRNTSYGTAEGDRNDAYNTAEAGRNTSYGTAEGSSAGSTAGDGSRWGAYKTEEAGRNSRMVALENAVFPLEASLTIEDNIILLEYTGTAVSKDISWAIKRQGAATTIDSMTLKQDGETIESGTSASGTQAASLNKLGITTFRVDATKDTLSASKTLNVEMVRKMYFGFADSTLADPTSLTAQTLKSSPVGTYTMSNGTAGKYLWLCVGTNKTINGVTSGGFEVPMEDAETIGNYKCYRSSEALAAGSITFTII